MPNKTRLILEKSASSFILCSHFKNLHTTKPQRIRGRLRFGSAGMLWSHLQTIHAILSGPLHREHTTFCIDMNNKTCKLRGWKSFIINVKVKRFNFYLEPLDLMLICLRGCHNFTTSIPVWTKYRAYKVIQNVSPSLNHRKYILNAFGQKSWLTVTVALWLTVALFSAGYSSPHYSEIVV